MLALPTRLHAERLREQVGGSGWGAESVQQTVLSVSSWTSWTNYNCNVAPEVPTGGQAMHEKYL